MKVLISTDTYHPHVNGASYFTQRLAYYLQAHGHEVMVLAPSESSKDESRQINSVHVLGASSYPIFFYPGFRFCMFPFGSAFIKKALDEFKPDVVHIQGHFAVSRTLVKYARRKGIPLVATNHFMPENLVHYLPLASIVGPALTSLAWRDFAGVFKNASHITTPTETAASLIRPYFKMPVTPISCGIDMGLFKPENDGSYLKERYGLSELPSLLYVGRLDREKNLDLVIRAFAKASETATFQLVIAGSGAEKENLKSLCEELRIADKVTFAGFVPDADLPCLYSIASGFVIAGTAELQSIVTMEAMATGLPILAVNAVALPELAKDGENGFLFEPGDTEGLAQKMSRLYSGESLRKTMGARSLELIKKHSIGESIRKFEKIYEEAMHDGKQNQNGAR